MNDHAGLSPDGTDRDADAVCEARLGPVDCAWWPYRHGERAEPRVRDWLGARFGMPASVLTFVRDARGRPRLDVAALQASALHDLSPHDLSLHDLDVNWSHSAECLIAARAHGWRVGIDVELLRPRPRAHELAARFFHPDEAATLSTLADDQDRHLGAFIRLWCAKEAVLKAHGQGLSFGLDRLRFVLDDVGDGAGEGAGAIPPDGADPLATPPRLVACDPALGRPEDWRLWTWSPRPGYLATLAARAA